MSNVVRFCETCQRTQSYGRCCVECGGTLKPSVILCGSCGAVIWSLPADACHVCQRAPLKFTVNIEWEAHA